jgi:hypothetical protein
MNWIRLAQDREAWKHNVNMVLNFWVPQMLGDSWVAEQLGC